VALRVEIDADRPLAGVRDRRKQVERGRGLADARPSG
jgi:hypothetical protein